MENNCTNIQLGNVASSWYCYHTLHSSLCDVVSPSLHLTAAGFVSDQSSLFFDSLPDFLYCTCLRVMSSSNYFLLWKRWISLVRFVFYCYKLKSPCLNRRNECFSFCRNLEFNTVYQSLSTFPVYVTTIDPISCELFHVSRILKQQLWLVCNDIQNNFIKMMTDHRIYWNTNGNKTTQIQLNVLNK